MSASGVLVDPKKVEAVMGWERPKSVFEIRGFLGLDGYYRRFENGLKLSIRARIVGLRLQDMNSMVGTVLTIEREIEDARSTRDVSVSSKRKDSQSSSSSGKRQRASSSRGSQSRGHPGQGQMRVSGQAGQMVCYHYQQPGHMRRDYPQRQGSQGFGTAQSQLAVEQESIRFIHPHPSTGQRNQFQFRGAIQALPTTQIGQRGQSVVRSQGQIRVAQRKRGGP